MIVFLVWFSLFIFFFFFFFFFYEKTMGTWRFVLL